MGDYEPKQESDYAALDPKALLRKFKIAGNLRASSNAPLSGVRVSNNTPMGAKEDGL